MRSLFVRLILAALVALVVVQVLAGVWSWAWSDHRIARRHHELLGGKLALAASWLEPLDREAREAELPVLRHSLAVHLDIGRAAPPGAVSTRLADGTVLTAEARPVPPRLDRIALTVLLSTLAFGGLLVWLGRPLLRDLEVLEDVTSRVGRGDLAARTGLSQGPVGAVGARFDAMADHLATLLQDQRRLMQSVSHEVRTPMARMRFQLDALGATATPDQTRWVDALDGELDAVDALLKQLLTVLAAERGTSDPPAPEATAALVADVVERMRILAEVRLEATVDGGLPMAARDQQTLLENLISNAQRHARTRVCIEVRGPVLVVHDDGPGVPDDARDRIFQSFASLDPSRNRQLGGVGLGLALVKRAADRWGAVVTVDRGPLGGARFTVRPAGSPS